MRKPNLDISSIVQQGLSRNATLYLNSPVNFIGQKGLKRFIKEIPSWPQVFSEEVLKKIYLHLIEFSGSTLPELPKEISGSCTGVINPHQGGRDKLATALQCYKNTFGSSEWGIAAEHFSESGRIIENIVHECVNDVCKQSFSSTEKYIPLLKQLEQSEMLAFQSLEYIHIRKKAKAIEHSL